MKKLAIFVLTTILIGCAPSGPPAQVQGSWRGWAEETMDIKTGLVLELTQKETEVTGKYHAQVVNSLGSQEHDGEVKGKVKGDQLTLTFTDPDLNLLPEVTFKVGQEGQDRTLGAYVQQDQSGIGTKYWLKQEKK